MKSNVFDFQSDKQTYIEEILRHYMPDRKINNVIPHFAFGHQSTDGFLPVTDTVVYFGQIRIDSGNPDIMVTDLNGNETGVMNPCLQNILFKGYENATPDCWFTGWKITLEDMPVNLPSPTPPITPPAVEGFQLFYGRYNLFENPENKVFGAYGWEKCNRNCVIEILTMSNVSLMLTEIGPETPAKLFYKAGYGENPIALSPTGVKVRFYESVEDGQKGELLNEIVYTGRYRFPLDFDVVKPASMSPVAYMQDGNNIFENLEMSVYTIKFKNATSIPGGTFIANTGNVNVDIIEDGYIEHTTTGNMITDALPLLLLLSLSIKFPGGDYVALDLLREVL